MAFNSVLLSQVRDDGAFFAPVVRISAMKGQTVALAGGRGGWIINKNFVLGGGFYGLESNLYDDTIDPLNGSRPLVRINYGGIDLEYIFNPGSPLHASVEVLLAGGGISFKQKNDKLPSSPFFPVSLLAWEPQLNIEYIAGDWIHLSLGFGYRWFTGFENYYGLEISRLNNFSGIFAIKLGKF